VCPVASGTRTPMARLIGTVFYPIMSKSFLTEASSLFVPSFARTSYREKASSAKLCAHPIFSVLFDHRRQGPLPDIDNGCTHLQHPTRCICAKLLSSHRCIGRIRDLVSTSIHFGGSSGRVTGLWSPNSEVSGSQWPCYAGPHP
jgi:hypothetical protein